MEKTNIEQKIENLEKAVKNANHEIERLQAVNEIQNVFSRLDYFHASCKKKEALDLFALKSPDVSAEVAATGVYVGENVKKLIMIEGGSEPRVGGLGLHCRTTAVIEVARDGKTAKALWLSPGLETGPFAGKKLEAAWCWCKYGVDFIKEDGRWKIWHLHTYPVFKVPYDQSWVEAKTYIVPRQLQNELKPDKPTTYLYEYSPDKKYEDIPAPPQPYETWDGKTMAAP
jgi:hypothetical protein